MGMPFRNVELTGSTLELVEGGSGVRTTSIALAALERARERTDREALLIPRGTCKDCQDDIPAARLAALPDAVRCIDCQRTHELRR